jgi:hypothetical protein
MVITLVAWSAFPRSQSQNANGLNEDGLRSRSSDDIRQSAVAPPDAIRQHYPEDDVRNSSYPARLAKPSSRALEIQYTTFFVNNAKHAQDFLRSFRIQSPDA